MNKPETFEQFTRRIDSDPELREKVNADAEATKEMRKQLNDLIGKTIDDGVGDTDILAALTVNTMEIAALVAHTMGAPWSEMQDGMRNFVDQFPFEEFIRGVKKRQERHNGS
jgi:hypothetical protein